MEGTIFSIEEFAVNDGPGIRTAIFLKGCPLRCQWCHNPEGLSFQPQFLLKKNGEKTLCGETISSENLAAKILRNAEIYAINDGGVTFTGGEPLAQADFLFDVVSKIDGKVHSAIETSGYARSEVFGKIADAVNLVMIDFKAANPEIHKKFTGVDNAQIIENLKYLCGANTDFILRIPLIPTVNDTLENMSALLEIVRGAKRLLRVEILPYHKTAGAKYYMVGKKYSPQFDVDARPKVFDVFTKNKIKCVVL